VSGEQLDGILVQLDLRGRRVVAHLDEQVEVLHERADAVVPQ
jgi:hypothetical protein